MRNIMPPNDIFNDFVNPRLNSSSSLCPLISTYPELYIAFLLIFKQPLKKNQVILWKNISGSIGLAWILFYLYGVNRVLRSLAKNYECIV